MIKRKKFSINKIFRLQREERKVVVEKLCFKRIRKNRRERIIENY